MPPIRPSALPAAVLLTFLAIACRDLPVQPRVPTTQEQTPSTAQQVRIRTFSGQRADSVLELLESAWAQHGHPEYREVRLAWRRLHGLPGRVVDDPANRQSAHRPNAILVDGDGAPPKPEPRVITHNERLYFGFKTPDGRVTPDGIEAEMEFIGDQGNISVSGGQIRGNNSSTHSISGAITSGPGTLRNCTDVMFASCENRRFLNGLMLIDGAPVCDAQGSATVQYVPQNLSDSWGVSITGTPIQVIRNANSGTAVIAQVSETAPPCPADDGQNQQPDQPTDGSGSGGGGTSQPSTDPGSPPPPSDPAPPTNGTPVDFWCETVNDYEIVNGVKYLTSSVVICFRDN